MTPETPVERRLRELVEEWRAYAGELDVAGHPTRAEAFSDAATEVEEALAQLLARCGGQEGT